MSSSKRLESGLTICEMGCTSSLIFQVCCYYRELSSYTTARMVAMLTRYKLVIPHMLILTSTLGLTLPVFSAVKAMILIDRAIL